MTRDRNAMDTDDYYERYLGPVPHDDAEADAMHGDYEDDYEEEADA